MVNQLLHPSQDMVFVGNYYLTMEEERHEGEGMIFRDMNEAVLVMAKWLRAFYTSRIGVQTTLLGDKTIY